MVLEQTGGHSVGELTVHPGRPDPLHGLDSLPRSREDRWLGGVCGGIAQLSGIAAWFLRLVFALLLLCGGTGLLIYLLMWVFVPLDEPPVISQRTA